MRILTPVELKEQRLRVSTREHERIMDMLLENEAAIEKVTPPPPKTLPNAKTLARRIDEDVSFRARANCSFEFEC